MSAIHLRPVAPSGPLAGALRRRGGRAFRIDVGPTRGDLVLALPAAPGPLRVIAPRGLGRSLLARGNGPWRAEGGGERCLPARWVGVGGVAAWLREVERPRAADAVAPGQARSGDGLHVVVLPVDAAWAEARRADPSVGRGPVVLLRAGRVVGLSPQARAAGLRRGMSLRLARRRVPELRAVEGVEGEAMYARLGALLAQEVAEPGRVRGGWAATLPAAKSAAAMGLAAWIVARAWQALGVEVRVAVGPDRASTLALARALPAGLAGVVTASAGAAWTAPGRAPVVLPDLEGLVVGAREIARGARDGDRLRLVGAAGSVEVELAPGRGADRAEQLVRRHGLALGEGVRVQLRRSPTPAEPRQLPLAVGMG